MSSSSLFFLHGEGYINSGSILLIKIDDLRVAVVSVELRTNNVDFGDIAIELSEPYLVLRMIEFRYSLIMSDLFCRQKREENRGFESFDSSCTIDDEKKSKYHLEEVTSDEIMF
ncbi:hypothetical protein Gotur_016086 [Gossypium turneri]